MNLADRRREYAAEPLEERDVAADPLVQFARWYEAAELAEVLDANAAALATVGQGQPTARMVLLKGIERDAFVFYTNWESRKAAELDAAPHATLLFYWRELARQVRVEGTTARVPAAAADAYFATRPRESQLGAWASPQSAVIPDRDALLRAFSDVERRFAGGPVPRPPAWGGYALTPAFVEFWQGRPGRLHDRLRYRRDGTAWRVERLAP